MNASLPLSTYQQPATGLASPFSLPLEPEPVAVADGDAERPSLPGPRVLPRLRRGFELETPQTDALTLIQLQTQAGNVHNTSSMTLALEEVLTSLAEDPSQDVAALLETKKFSVHSLSGFGRAYQFEPGQDVSVAWFLRENALLVPKNIEQLANLITVIKEPLPEHVEHGNYWGLLSQPATLDADQRTRASELAAAEMAKVSPGKGMFSVFYEKYADALEGKSSAQVLEEMIGSPEVRALGATLKQTLDGDGRLSGNDADWSMAAMVLELDPQAGSKRGVVAGYDLYQAGNRDVHPSVVVERLEKHLVEQGKVPAQMAPAAARLLLAGAEPAFIVQDIPAKLTLKSAAFARLSAVVQTQEFWAPGIATHTDFPTFMRLASHSPVSDAEAVVEAKAQSNALIQWGIAQKKLVAKTDDDYTEQEVAGLHEAFNAQFATLKKAYEQVSATMPTRKDMALAQLQETYGISGPFDVANTRITKSDASESREHSVQDIYMAGKMERIVKGPLFDFSVGTHHYRVRPMPDINQAHDTRFASYFKDLKAGVTTLARQQLSDLSEEDQQTIASGKVEFFSLRKASVEEAEKRESPQEALAAKARYGLFMRVVTKIDKNGSDKDFKNLRHVYYEVFPLQGTIRARHDLSRWLPNPTPAAGDPENHIALRGKGVHMWVDYEAFANGTPPGAPQYTGGLLNEQVRAPHLPESKAGQTPTADAINARFDTIANVIADHLLDDGSAMKAGARGVTEVEKDEADIKARHDFILGLIPFKNAIENAAKGNTGEAVKDFALDIFGFILPFGKGLGQAGKALGKLGVKLGPRAFKASDSILRSVASGLNPADGLGDLVVGVARGGKTVLKSSYRELKKALQAQSSTFSTPLKVSNTVSEIGEASRQLPDFSAHALPDSLLEGRTIRGDGTFQVGDQFYVRYTDGTGTSKVFEISNVYKVGGGHVRVVDPVTKKTVMFLEPTGEGQWRLNRMQGGVKPDPTRPTFAGISTLRPHPPKRPAGQGSSTVGPSSGQSAAKRPKVIEAFPGEKALLDPPVKGKNQFYHYTGAKSHASIAADWNLRPSAYNVDGKPLPGGQRRHYFTDLAPEDMGTEAISETIFGRRRYGNALDKMTHYYEVNTSGLNMVKTDNPHIFYVDTKFDLPLKYRVNSELTNRIISHGQTPYTS